MVKIPPCNLKLVAVLFPGIILSIFAMPRPDAFDDEGEMSVPRSPKIQGTATVTLRYTKPTEVSNLQCTIEGSPTPTVIWSKDGQEIRDESDLYNMTYNVTDGKAEFKFLESARHEKKFVTGNFSCIAANFLGRVQKIFAIELTDDQTLSTTNSLSIDTNITAGGRPADEQSGIGRTDASKPVNTSSTPDNYATTSSTLVNSTSPTPGTQPGSPTTRKLISITPEMTTISSTNRTKH